MGSLGAAIARARRRQVRPTAEGGWFALLLLGVLVAAVNTGNNLLYLVLALQLSALVISNAMAEWNLRGLHVARRLPLEAYAGQPAMGAFVLHNRRRWGASYAVHTDEQGGEAAASAAAAWIPVGGRVELPASWTFAARGPAKLERIRIWSSFPFGFVRRSRDVDAPAEILVYPAPLSSGPAHADGLGHGARESPLRQGRSGDFRGIRAYVPGDSLRDLHWPTSARVGQPMVVERVAEIADEVVVEVSERDGVAWESALCRATGQILWHFQLGHAVGLLLSGRRLPPRSGDAWRRQLLGMLAAAPWRGT